MSGAVDPESVQSSSNRYDHLKIVSTADGSNTIYNSRVGENYHSANGALQESRHVFLNAGLKYFLEHYPENNSVSILEVGFGTGLNFLLTADYCIKQHIKLNYTGIEAYPLTGDMISQTGYQKYIATDLWREFIEGYGNAFNSSIRLSDCQLQIAHCQLLQCTPAHKFDILYFDAFAAAYQPEMWNDEAISHTMRFLKTGGVFVTYAITGNLKRSLKALGCKVEKVPGAAGKREMLRAIAG
ncbi:MAG: tRNA (5-methylaminomethyl-2-thiouridine)(34)-methyltransferase MnmD [Mucilaginibacter sp.]